MTATINPDKLAQLDSIDLDLGNHTRFDEGHCAMEVVAWLADQGHTDAPECASPVLTRYTIRLNDRWNHDQRQQLKPYLPRMIGTGGDGKDEFRGQVAARFLVSRLLGPWLQLAGMTDEADSLQNLSGDELRAALWRVRDAAWALRRKKRDLLVSKVKERLSERNAVAAAVAAADADAAAAAAAVAAAVDVAAAAADYWTSYSAAYDAARQYYREHPLPISQQIADLAAQQQPLALELLDQLIDPERAAL